MWWLNRLVINGKLLFVFQFNLSLKIGFIMFTEFSRKKQQKLKTDNVKIGALFIIATNFNETSMPLTHIGSDYFSCLSLSKFLKLWKVIIFLKENYQKYQKLGNFLEFSFPQFDILICD